MSLFRRILQIPRVVIGWLFASDCNLPLPCSQTVTSDDTALLITNTGGGRAGWFRVDNFNNNQFALRVGTNGDAPALGAITGGSSNAGYFEVQGGNFNDQSAIHARNEANGRAGYFTIPNSENSENALEAQTSGNGTAFYARTYGFGNAIMGYTNSGAGKAGLFRIENSGNSQDALRGETTGSGWAGNFIGHGNNSKGVRVWVANNNQPGLEVANGTKNGVVATSDGARALYAEEAAEVWFSDYGFGQLQGGQVEVAIDTVFAQTVNLEEPYHVFVQSYGTANLYVSERSQTGFVVQGRDGDEDVAFSYRIVAKRCGYEKLRLERSPWADIDPNLYPERREEWEAQFSPIPNDAPEESFQG